MGIPFTCAFTSGLKNAGLLVSFGAAEFGGRVAEPVAAFPPHKALIDIRSALLAEIMFDLFFFISHSHLV